MRCTVHMVCCVYGVLYVRGVCVCVYKRAGGHVYVCSHMYIRTYEVCV